jgi:hypothetical protein
MIIETSTGTPVNSELLYNYFKALVNRFFKILPIRETEDTSLTVYMQGLQRELLGCKELIPELRTDAVYLSLLGILQYLIDNPECTVREVRREVFSAISLCNKLKSVYAERGL